MPPALTVLGSPEMVEHIISFLNFFEYVGPLAASCSITWNVLRLPQQDHAHNIRQFRERMNMVWYWEAQMHLLGLDLDRDYYWNSDAVGV